MRGILWAVLSAPLEIPALFPNRQSRHVTLAYGVDRAPYEPFISLPMTVALTEICHNDEIQAVRVVLPSWCPFLLAMPHITISWADGSAPVKSTEMLQGVHQSSESPIATVQTRIEFLEWKEENPRKWSDRTPVLCPTCLNQGVETWTRSLTHQCRRHRNADKKSGSQPDRLV